MIELPPIQLVDVAIFTSFDRCLAMLALALAVALNVTPLPILYTGLLNRPNTPCDGF